jgi:hypothetical protein
MTGSECVHIDIDDCTRLAHAEVLADQSRQTVIGFLRRAVGFYARHRSVRMNRSALSLSVCGDGCGDMGEGGAEHQQPCVAAAASDGVGADHLPA